MGKKRRPLQWIEDATPAEIGEALLAVDQVKAAQVGAYLATRIGPEASNLLERAGAELERDPVGALLRGFKGIAGS